MVKSCMMNDCRSRVFGLVIFAWVLYIDTADARTRIRVPIARRVVDISRLETLATLHPNVFAESVNVLANNSNSIHLANFQTLEYTGPISVGTPKQDFTIVYDTGSSDFWLLSSKTSQQKKNFLHYYDGAKSSTFASLQASWGIQYGKGACAGKQARDHVSLGGLQADNQVFGEATSYSKNFEQETAGAIDGIMGLAWRTQMQGPTFIEHLHQTGQISRRTVSFYLTPDLNQEGSEMIVGEPDTKYAPHGLVSVKLLNAKIWKVHLGALLIDGTQFQCSKAAPCIGLLDTGTSVIGVPAQHWSGLVSLLTKHRSDCGLDQYQQLRCNTAFGYAGLPVITIGIGDEIWPLYPHHYMLKDFMAFVPLPPSLNLWILGDTFLKTYYTVFDHENTEIGIAKSPDAPQFTAQLFFTVVGIMGAAILLSLGVVHLYRKREQMLVASRGVRLDGNRALPEVPSA